MRNLLLCCLGGILLAGCGTSATAPRVFSQRATAEKLGEDQFLVTLEFAVANPTSGELRLAKAQYTAKLGGQEVRRADSIAFETLPGGKSTVIPVRIALTRDQLKRVPTDASGAAILDFAATLAFTPAPADEPLVHTEPDIILPLAHRAPLNVREMLASP